VVVSGRQSYDNKGRVVESWEPYHDTGWGYAPSTGPQTGQKAVQFYDAGGRTWKSLAPDGTETRVVFGTPAAASTPWDHAPTPWERWSYDANDLASLTHGTTGHNVPAHHWWTPRTEYVDALGRVTRTIDRNHDGTAAQDVEMHYHFDIRGNLLRVDDALKVAGASRPSAFTHMYDYANRPLRTVHIEKGASTAVFSAVGQTVEARDAKGALALSAHDTLLRPTRAWARDKAGEAVTLRQVQVYGEDKASPSATNHIGRPWKSYDGAGLVEIGEYDFKGNPLWKERRVVSDDEVLSVFTPQPANWAVQSWVIDWTGLPARESILETAVHRTDMVYDALNRPTSVTLPADAVGTRSVLEPSYNRAGAVEALSLDGTAHIRHIAYNAKGQRVLAAYGNGIMTRHAYDPVNFRLLRQRSEPYAHPPGQPHTYAFQGGVRQDTAYQYDLAGNITPMVDASPGAGVGGTGSLQRDFEYDALYRLLLATGRESGAYATSPDPWMEPHVPDSSAAATRAYTRTYSYDALGNLLRLRNVATGNTWNRWYNNADTLGQAAYAGSNLLATVTYGSYSVNQSYDACGNLVQEGAARFLEWDAADQLRAFRTQSGSSEPSEYAHYLYDAGGDRVKKVVRKQLGGVAVSVYLGGVEHHYEVTGGVRDEEYSETHVMDGRSRVCVLKIFAASWSGSTSDAVQYNLEDHLGNACFLLDGGGGLVSREEYYPFGETSYCYFGKQRYRFCGKERDEESGLYYYGARYYAPWCCRFVSVDPLAAKYPFYTPYQYAGNQPVISVDIDGLEGDKPNNSQKVEISRTETIKSDDSNKTSITKKFDIEFSGDKIIVHTTDTKVDVLDGEVVSRNEVTAGPYIIERGTREEDEFLSGVLEKVDLAKDVGKGATAGFWNSLIRQQKYNSQLTIIKENYRPFTDGALSTVPLEDVKSRAIEANDVRNRGREAMQKLLTKGGFAQSKMIEGNRSFSHMLEKKSVGAVSEKGALNEVIRSAAKSNQLVNGFSKLGKWGGGVLILNSIRESIMNIANGGIGVFWKEVGGWIAGFLGAEAGAILGTAVASFAIGLFAIGGPLAIGLILVCAFAGSALGSYMMVPIGEKAFEHATSPDNSSPRMGGNGLGNFHF